jgi:type IV fimbrial biogenesis protein FimT
MVAIAVLGCLLQVAVPSFVSVLNSVRISTATNALLRDLMLSRSEAIKRNVRVVLCKSDTGDRCTSDGGWEQGWIVFFDMNGNTTLDLGETILRRMDGLTGPLKIYGNNNLRTHVVYSASGGFQAGTFTVCVDHPSRTYVRRVVLNRTGRARTEQGEASAC